MKLVLEERESAALVAGLGDRAIRVSSVLAYVEVHRAARRVAPEAAARADEVLELVTLIELDRAILDGARAVEPLGVRTLDAVHLSTALSLGPELDVLVAYDRRLAEAAADAGVQVLAPT